MTDYSVQGVTVSVMRKTTFPSSVERNDSVKSSPFYPHVSVSRSQATQQSGTCCNSASRMACSAPHRLFQRSSQRGEHPQRHAKTVSPLASTVQHNIQNRWAPYRYKHTATGLSSVSCSAFRVCQFHSSPEPGFALLRLEPVGAAEARKPP
jgi:hypothetical protein